MSAVSTVVVPLTCITSNFYTNSHLKHTVLNPCAAILYKLKLDQTVSTISTVGFNVETFTYKKVKFTVWVRFSLFFKFIFIILHSGLPLQCSLVLT